MANIPREIEAMIKVFNMLYGVEQSCFSNYYQKNALLTYKYGDLMPYAAE